jgi:hypothetical protein
MSRRIMIGIRVTLLTAISLLIGLHTADAETADCRALLKRQDAQCQALAEKLAAACPSGTHIKENAQCREISNEIASACTRKPCAPAPRKRRKASSKSKGMGGKSGGMSGGMGETRSKPAKQ